MLALCLWGLTAQAAEVRYDVLIHTATPSGIAAALGAADACALCRIGLLEPSGSIGGMSTAGGIGMRDFMQEDRLKSTLHEWAMLNAAHYGVSYPVWQPDNYIGEQSFWAMLKNRSQVTVKTNCGLGSFVGRFGRSRIESLNCGDELFELAPAGVVIDASYEANIVMEIGASYAIGREDKYRYLETLAGVQAGSLNVFQYPIDALSESGELLKYVTKSVDPRTVAGEADVENVMAYSYRVCVTSNSAKALPIQKPEGYRTEDFELARRLFLSEEAVGNGYSLPWNLYNYRNYPPNDKFDVCCGYSPFGIDAVGLAVGYSNGTIQERDRIAKDHEYYVKGLMWFWIRDNESGIPDEVRAQYASYGLCADEWTDNGNFPTQLYVREAARLIGDRVYTQNDRRTADEYACSFDSIATGDWLFDNHQMTRVAVPSSTSASGFEVFNEGLVMATDNVKVYEIPYWILLPKRQEVSNLLVSTSPSVSHVAYGSIRVEPTLWQLGQAAGIAASVCSNAGLRFVHDVDLSVVRAHLKSQGAVYQWPTDKKCVEANTLQL